MASQDGRVSTATPVGALGILLADGRLPTGGHAHSVGLEAAVRIGEVTDVDSLARFAAARLDTQGRVDAAFAAAAAHAWRSDEEDLADRLATLVAEFDARTVSPHLRANSRTLGRHLVRAAAAIVDEPDRLRTLLSSAPRPVVAGAVVADLGLAPRYAAAVECHHLVSAICASAVKLLGLDPLATVRVQADLAERIDAIASVHARLVEPHDLVAAAPGRSEILAEWHAADATRLFAT